MKASELVKTAIDIATKYKTLYVMGCFGAPMSESNKQRYCNNHSYNKQPSRTEKIQNATADTFGFDCVCLFKGILWGWAGKINEVYGGAKYQDGMPDATIKEIADSCDGISSDFSNVQAGEFLWNATYSHCGICVGYVNGKLCQVEATPGWGDGVQLFEINKGNKFSYHGKSKYVEYDTLSPADMTPPINELTFPVRQVYKGCQGEYVKPVQAILKGLGYYTGNVDGDAGAKTSAAIKAFQYAKGLDADGYFGVNSWKAFLGID